MSESDVYRRQILTSKFVPALEGLGHECILVPLHVKYVYDIHGSVQYKAINFLKHVFWNEMSTPPLGHGGSPQYWVLHVDGEETFLFLSNRRDREPNPELLR